METLKNSAQFERVRREGRTWSAGALVLNAARNDQQVVRCGFITAKKVGKAVRRNRARRLIREAVRLRLPLIQPGWDLVWVARPSIVEADFATVSKAVDDLLARGRLVDVQSAPPDETKVETAAGQSRIIDEHEGAQTAPPHNGTHNDTQIENAHAAQGQEKGDI
ncbi:MAG TPA: ribonuclease P protein component [Chloroflexia bacterium]|nr:ribonuclease P protein component [Chloroflexia bacterium]